MRTRRTTLLSLAAAAAWGCVSYAKPLPVLPPSAPERGPAPPVSDKARQVQLKTIVVALPVGHAWGEMSWGYSGRCYQKQPLVNTTGRFELERDGYVDLFDAAMKQHGFPVEDDLELFADSKERVADLAVAGKVVDATVNECFPVLNDNKLKVRGNAYLQIEWSVYSKLEKKVVLVTRTAGSTGGEIESTVGEQGLLRAAFRDAVGRLARSPAYREVVDPPARPAQPAPAAAVAAAVARVRRAPALAGGLDANLAAVREAVATVTANKGSGSGFVISADGHVVTAAHVVAGSKYVKVNTGAGKECYGEVVAANRQRDLALIRLDCGGLRPLPIASRVPAQGGEVFAVGTPLSDEFRASITKGVVSGVRTREGLEYIQSDVTVLPGSSGGPLLDGAGNVVGVATSGVALQFGGVGVNFFVPAAEIEKYLPIAFE
jgi:S1-C subfamily serine protease